jgi:hypothetical protein
MVKNECTSGSFLFKGKAKRNHRRCEREMQVTTDFVDGGFAHAGKIGRIFEDAGERLAGEAGIMTRKLFDL